MTVTLYTRRGCHLCDDARELLEEIRGKVAFELVETDIDRDSDLRARYGWEVPVVQISEREFKHPITAAQILRALGA